VVAQAGILESQAKTRERFAGIHAFAGNDTSQATLYFHRLALITGAGIYCREL
jgi:hypothetical protein